MIRYSSVTKLLLIFAVTSCYSTSMETDLPQQVTVCPDLTREARLDWTQIIGKWYVVEVIKHSVPLLPMRSSHIVVKTCPVVKLNLTRVGNGPTNIRLLWKEHAGDLDYSFNIESSNNPGKWVPNEPQNGTLVTEGYIQFAGTVQVMMAVKTHIVLTFCTTTADNRKYSVVLSKNRYLPESDINNIRELLTLRGLSNVIIQESCTNSGNRKELSTVVRWMTLILAIAATATRNTYNKF